MRFRLRTTWCLAAWSLLLPSWLMAQEHGAYVYGRLLDDATRAPIVGGSVSLVSANGNQVVSVVTDSLGRFRLAVKSSGEFRLKGERIGYQTGESPIFPLMPGDALPMDFWLSTRAVLLAPLEVKVSPRQWLDRRNSAAMAPFYERMQWFGRLGGVFITRDKVRDWDGSTISHMVAGLAGGHLDGRGNVLLRLNCSPAYYLNGHPFRLDAGESIDRFLAVSDLEAVEVYKGAATLPGEFGGSQGTCAVVLWTRRS